jgi:hypothetical protein
MTSPLPVFISYGHDRFSPFAEDLNARLTHAGFDTWFDTRIRPGNLLDGQIEQAIRDVAEANGAAVLLMTQHAMRAGPGQDYGYCLNELAFIRELGIDLLPVMVEPCERPASIRAMTYLDLSTDAEWLLSPTPQGDQARAVAAERIVAALRGAPVNLRVDDPEQLLRGRLRPPDFQPPPTLLPTSVPRTWITDKVDDWLRRDLRGLLITGTTGTGKSAFLRLLDDDHGALASLHYFKADDSQTLDLGHVVNAMAFKLSGQLPGYRSALIALLQGQAGADVLALEPLARFRRLVVEPVANLPAPEHPVVIALDALDEAGNRVENKALELLEVVADSAHLLPGWFRLLATSRPEAEVITALRGWERVDLDGYADNLVADDCRELVGLHLPTVSPAQRDALVAQAGGNLLVINLILEEARADNQEPDNASQDADSAASKDSRLTQCSPPGVPARPAVQAHRPAAPGHTRAGRLPARRAGLRPGRPAPAPPGRHRRGHRAHPHRRRAVRPDPGVAGADPRRRGRASSAAVPQQFRRVARRCRPVRRRPRGPRRRAPPAGRSGVGALPRRDPGRVGLPGQPAGGALGRQRSA